MTKPIGVCSNCDQWQWSSTGDCCHECARRGFASFARPAIAAAIDDANRNRPPVDTFPVGAIIRPRWHAGADGTVVGYAGDSVLVSWPARVVVDGPDTFEIDAFIGEYDTGFLAGRYSVVS